MIICWIKIMYYRIMFRKHAVPGTDTTVSRARHEAEISPEVYRLDPVRMNAERLWDLYTRGLVYAPTEDAAADRARIFETDRAQREQQGASSPGHCPCSGRHYPSADACRWCRCHDPLNVHHLPQGITAGSRLAEVYTGRSTARERVQRMQRDCPLTEDGTGCRDGSACDAEGRCTARALLDVYENRNHWSAYTDLPGPEHTGAEGRAMAEARQEIIRSSYRPCSVCGAPDHAGVKHDEIMAVRPSDEIVLCGACPHPEHVTGDRRCASSVPSSEPSGGIEMCRCGWTGEIS